MNNPLRHLATSFLFAALSFSLCTNSSADTASSLRSAYLGSSAWSEQLSAPAIKDQLREHFVEVIKKLQANQSSSLALSLRRAEAESSQTWTPSQRRAVLTYLMANRNLQIQRLSFYSDRGLFPLNEGQSENAVPIFVDRNQTHCAVGYLMHCDSDDSGVQAVVDTNNLVYVNDVREGRLLDWVRMSGLTREEAAMIQPAYPLPLDATFEDLNPKGATLEFDEFTLSDVSLRGFRFFANDVPASFEDTPDAIQPILEQGKALLEFNNAVGPAIRSQNGVLFELGLFPTQLSLSDSLYIGSDDEIFGTFIGSPSGSGDTGIVEIEYSLRLKPGSLMTQFALTSPENVNGSVNSVSGQQSAILLQSEILDGDTNELLGAPQLMVSGTGEPNGNNNTPLEGSLQFAIENDFIRVRTYGLVVGEGRDTAGPFHSVIHEFEVADVSIIPGDVNRDGVVDLLDIGPFVDLVISSGFQPEADVNGDGAVDLLDIDPFVALIVG